MAHFPFRLSLVSSPWMCGTLVATLSVFSVPGKPAVARNGFWTCAYELARAGISAPERASACGSALYPQDISGCVVGILRDNQEIGAVDALSTCRQVRRPLELAACVTEINRLRGGDRPPAAATVVLESCRRSLLPQRFSQCVVGLSREVELPTGELMTRCIEARDRPQGFYPNLPNGLQPLTPNPGAPPSLPPIPDTEPNLQQLGTPSR